jgi:hypothetical protein
MKITGLGKIINDAFKPMVDLVAKEVIKRLIDEHPELFASKRLPKGEWSNFRMVDGRIYVTFRGGRKFVSFDQGKTWE